MIDMSPNLVLVGVIVVLVTAGVYLLLERSLSRVLIGVILIGSAGLLHGLVAHYGDDGAELDAEFLQARQVGLGQIDGGQLARAETLGKDRDRGEEDIFADFGHDDAFVGQVANPPFR